MRLDISTILSKRPHYFSYSDLPPFAHAFAFSIFQHRFQIAAYVCAILLCKHYVDAQKNKYHYPSQYPNRWVLNQLVHHTSSYRENNNWGICKWLGLWKPIHLASCSLSMTFIFAYALAVDAVCHFYFLILNYQSSLFFVKHY